MASCSFPPSFIMLSPRTPPSLPGRELLFLSTQPATHPHVWVTSSAQTPSNPQQPPTPPPTSNPLQPRFLPALLSHSYSQRCNRDRITHNTRRLPKYGRTRYVRPSASCHRPSDSFLIPGSLTECCVCQLICFT